MRIRSFTIYIILLLGVWEKANAQQFNPTDISNISLWLKADTLLSDSSNTVTRWNNIIDTGIAFVQPTTSFRPIKVPNVLNGKQVLRFDGSNDFLSAGDTLDIGTLGRTIFVVGGKTAANPLGSFVAKSRAANNANRYGLYSDNTGLNFIYHDNANKNILVNPAPAKMNIFAATINRSTLQVKLFANSTQIGTTATGIQSSTYNHNSTNRLLIGSYGNSTDAGQVFPLNGDIAEVIFYNKALSDTERVQVEQYLRLRYAPQLSLGPDINVASGFCGITLASTGTFTNYLWSTGATTATVSVNTPGIYWVRATDNFGYITSDTIEVKYVEKKPMHDTTICLKDSVILNPRVTNGTYTYLWNNLTTSSILKVANPGAYSVQISDGTCLYYDTVIVSIDSFLTKVSLGPDTSLCSGNILGLAKGAGLVTSYLWADANQTAPTIPITTPGNYALTTTNLRGCTAKDTIAVAIKGTAPVISFTADTVCFGIATSFNEQINVQPPAVLSSRLWKFTPTDSSIAANPSFIFASPGVFNVQLTAITDVGCNSNFSKNILINTAPVAAFNLNSDACINNNYTFTSTSTVVPGDNIISYSWNFGDNTFATTSQVSHTYSSPGIVSVDLIVSNQNHCFDTASHPLNVVTTAPQTGAFSPITPANGYVDRLGSSIYFSWSASANAREYAIQISTDATFSNIIFSASSILGTSTSVSTLGANKYFWRVIALNICGQQTFGPTNQFTILNLNSIPDISLWLRSDSLIKDSLGYISSWNNIADTGIHFTQPNPSQRPLYITNTLNGKPVVRFDGTNDFLSAGDTLDIGTSGRTFFVVAGKLASNSLGSYFAKARATNATNRVGLYTDNTGLNYVYHDLANKTILVNPPPTKMNILSSTANRSTLQLKLFSNSNQIGSGTAIQSASYDLNSATRMLVGAYGNANDNGEVFYLNGDVAEILFYNRALSDTERTNIEQYLRFRYAPQLNLGPDTTVSYGFCKLTLNAGNFTNFVWSTGETTQTIDIKKSGKYWVRALDIFGYTTSDTINVNYKSENPIADTTVCFGDTALLDTKISGAYTFLWNNAQTSSAIKTVQSGIFSVKITDNIGCTYVDTVVVNIDSFGTKVSLGMDTLLCSGNLLGLQQGVSLPTSYLWSTNETGSTISITNPGTYTLIASNLRGCVAKDTINVTIKGIAPVIDFSADSVCLGFPTSFTEQTTIFPPANLSSRLWRFSTVDSSTLQNPQFIFPGTGSFNVQFTVSTDVGCNTTINKNIWVKAKPIAGFNLLTDACINYNYSFISTSTALVGDVLTAFNWDFGDNNTSLSNPASHTYSTVGNFNVQLIVSNQNSCKDTIVKALSVVASAPLPGPFNLLTPPDNFVEQAGKPITFTWSGSQNAQFYSLQLAIDAQFSNIVNSSNGLTATSTSISNLAPNTYYWRVISSNICGQQSIGERRVIKIFNLASIPDMNLWVRADSLVTDSSGFVSNWKNIADTGIHFSQTIPASRPLKTTNILNGKTVMRFDGSDDFLSAGDTLDLGISSRTFFVVGGKLSANSSGSYFAKSVATNAANRIGIYTDNNGLNYVYHDAANKTILINPQPPKLNILSSVIDRSALQVKLFANSQLLGSTTGIQGATYNLNSTSRLLLGAYGNSSDNAQVFPLNGDIAEVIFYNRALTDQERNQVDQYLRFRYAPQINLGPDISVAYGVCDTTLRIPAFFTKIKWSTGDTTLTTKVKQPGKYWVSALDYFGYVTSDTINVAVPYSGITPSGGDTICLGSTTTLQYNIIGTPYHFLWSTGDTTSSISVSAEGKYSILISDTNGCTRRDTVSVLVDSISLFSLLSTDTTTCKNTPLALHPYKFPYRNYSWSTGGTKDTIILNSSGAIFVTVTDIVGCSVSDTINVLFKGTKPDADFTGGNTCLGDSSIYIDQSLAYGPEHLILWKWNFGNGDTATSTISENRTTYYPTSGNYTTTLTVTTDSGCVGSIAKTFKVSPTPTGNFIWNIACAGSPTNFVDRSTIAVTDTISSWEWDINGTSSSAKNPGILFPSQGEFTTTLIVTTNAGCADTVSRMVEVFAPLVADFDAGSVCLGDTLNFEDKTKSFSVINWLWSFGDNTPFALTQNTIHKYLAAGTYEVVLKIENTIGCKDSVAKNVVVVAKPNADFNSSPACLGQPISLSDNSQSVSEPVVKWNWIINGQNYNAQAPSVLFGDTGLYDAKLIVETGTGCKDSITKSLSVKPLPTAAFTFTPLYGEAPVTANFTNTSTGANSYLWDFGDGITDNSKNTSHTYQSNADFTITLNATSSFGCTDSAKKQFIVRPTNLNLLVEDISTQLVQQGNGSLIQTSVRLANVGTRLITNASLYATLGNNGIVTEEWNGLLQPGQIILYTFNSRFVLSANNDKTYVCVEAVSVNNGEEESSIADNRSCTTIDGKAKVIGPYPNPANGDSKIGFVLAKSDVVTVNIFDTYGHSNYNIQQTLPKGRTDITLPTSGLMAGTYYVKVQFADDNYLIKLVITN